MPKKKRPIHNHEPNKVGSEMRDIILGGQDGLVNVLGVVLAIAAATIDTKTIIIAGLAATFAESISMAAVAYTSTKASRDYYNSQLETEKKEIKKMPVLERQEIKDIYFSKGFRGRQLANIVKKITSNKKLWLETMMSEELGLSRDHEKPGKSAAVVGLSAFAGSLFPLLPFFFLSPIAGVIPALVLSVIVLFGLGAAKAKVTVGSWLRSGAEIAVIGLAAALIGYGLGSGLGVLI
ncbi:MAG: VIT1/CCC1 transporter family protein [Candidatus Aenigmarchaeota archaeon]|nr:VIT1/CCC1 transporter family protein [Candidatus Aenigmarchaeota archaeon]